MLIFSVLKLKKVQKNYRARCISETKLMLLQHIRKDTYNFFLYKKTRINMSGRRGRSRPKHNFDEGIHSGSSHGANWVLTLLGVIVAAVALGLAIPAIIRATNHNNFRHDIHQLRAAIAPIGFSAWKNGSQSIINSTVTTVSGWETIGGIPAYDATLGGFNATIGVFIADVEAIYSVEGTICWLATDAGGIREARLMTNGVVAAVFSRIGELNISGFTCLAVAQHQSLDVGDSVWLVAYQDSFVIQDVTELSRFSIERVAQNCI